MPIPSRFNSLRLTTSNVDSQKILLTEEDAALHVNDARVLSNNSSLVSGDYGATGFYLYNLPTTDPETEGQLWSDSGTIKVSALVYDTDAQTYFTALEASSGWSAPADYAAKKLAISDYIKAMKTAGNWTKVKAVYLPIWRLAAANALSMKRSEDGSAVTTYDLTFYGTITHTDGDYIYGDGTTGYGSAAFRGPGATSGSVFFGLTDFSWGGNVVDFNNTANSSTLCGWRREGNLVPYHSSTYVRASAWRYAQYFLPNITPETGLQVVQSVTPTGSNTNALELYRNGSSEGSAGFGTYQLASKTNDWSILAGAYNGTMYDFAKFKINFAFAGIELADVAAFNTDTTTFLAAL